MNFELKVHTSSLRIPGDPRDGRLTVYASVRLGRKTWYLSRWDTQRVQRNSSVTWVWPGKVMCWYGGRF